MAPDDGFQGAPPLQPGATTADLINAINKGQADLYIFSMAQQRNSLEIAGLKQRETERHSEMTDLLRQIRDAIGSEGEDEYGKRTGTGVRGRIMRLELARAAMMRYAAGFFGAAVLFGGALSWATSRAIDIFLERGLT